MWVDLIVTGRKCAKFGSKDRGYRLFKGHSSVGNSCETCGRRCSKSALYGIATCLQAAVSSVGFIANVVHIQHIKAHQKKVTFKVFTTFERFDAATDSALAFLGG